MEYLGGRLQMKIVVFGATGMLGRYVTKYLSQNYEVIPVTRKDFDFAKANQSMLNKFLDSLNFQFGDVLINCIGIIKPQIAVVGEYESIFINSAFPHVVAEYCDKNKINFIHATTDCIYSGDKGMYTEEDPMDVSDIYGVSKAMGESEKATNIRVSIIGEEYGQARSLVEWIKGSKDKTVNGFIDHLWNGITCLEWAKLVENMIQTDDFWKGTVHAYSPKAVTKAELVQMVSDIYDLNIKVNATHSNKSCDRTLSSVKLNLIKKPLSEQIKEMKEFSLE
jgi:dTDP-4-dehydrorhamnose reductase